jgi:hypothetical protein
MSKKEVVENKETDVNMSVNGFIVIDPPTGCGAPAPSVSTVPLA